MARGTYNELQFSGVDIDALQKINEEQKRCALLSDPDNASLLSQRTNHSRCSDSSLLPPESPSADQLPVRPVHLFITWF